MKSQLFSKNDLTRSEGFLKDLDVVADLPEEALYAIPDYTYEAMAEETTAETNKVYEKASAKLGIPQSFLIHAIKFSEFFIRQCLPEEDGADDQPKNLATDLLELIKVDSDNKKDAFTQYFVKIKQLAGGDANKLIVRRRHAHAVLPNLLGITVRTDLRMVFEKYFEAGDSIDDFKSECYGAVPVGIIKLTISKQEGDEPIVFQADRKTVRWIIDHLTALDKQIDAAERYFKLKEVD